MTGTTLPSHTNPSPFNQLRQQMAESFSLDDVRSLCFDLNVNFDELPHAGLTPKIRDLILLLKQNGRLAELDSVEWVEGGQEIWRAIERYKSKA